MATERNVVDFKIHNLTEEQFQELKAQGKIDPNAVYCTPDITKERLDALETKTTSLESKTTSLETNKQDKGDYATNTALSQGLAKKQDKGDYATNTALSEGLSQKQDKATAINYDNITNCITEIPQDIKLELADGAITLKAGSKVYVPNGVGKFDVVTIGNDVTTTETTNNTFIILYYPNGNYLAKTIVSNCASGSSQPSLNNYGFWFDTTNNLIKRYVSGFDNGGYSLPVAIVTVSNGAISSIDQAFNGFGYMGSTVFALPGVKGVVPNGRNKDGTLKNGIVTLNEVSTYTTSGNFDKWGVYISSGGKLYTIINSFVYNERENLIRNTTDGTPFGVFQCGTATSIDNRISLQPGTTFHAVDYNDTDFIANQAMPSDNYTDLTLGASGASYTAPADGWLVLNKLSSGTSYQFVQIYNTKTADRRIGASTSNAAYLCATMPLAKGDRVLVEYSASGVTKLFRFIYANGAK